MTTYQSLLIKLILFFIIGYGQNLKALKFMRLPIYLKLKKYAQTYIKNFRDLSQRSYQYSTTFGGKLVELWRKVSPVSKKAALLGAGVLNVPLMLMDVYDLIPETVENEETRIVQLIDYFCLSSIEDPTFYTTNLPFFDYPGSETLKDAVDICIKELNPYFQFSENEIISD